MADYGIFGHGSSGNSWFSRRLNDFHDSTKKYDPLGHYSVENPMKSAHWLVEKSSKGLADAGIGEGFNTRLNQEANENGNDFGLGSQRMGLGILSVLGAMYGGSYLGAGEAGAGGAGVGEAGGAAAGNGAFLGEGVASGIPAWDGAAGGMGLGVTGGGTFNPNGLPEGSSYASDFPTGGGSWWQKLMSGGSGGSGGQSSGGLLGSQKQEELEPVLLGNPLLLEALMKLVEEQQRQEGGMA